MGVGWIVIQRLPIIRHLRGERDSYAGVGKLARRSIAGAICRGIGQWAVYSVEARSPGLLAQRGRRQIVFASRPVMLRLEPRPSGM